MNSPKYFNEIIHPAPESPHYITIMHYTIAGFPWADLCRWMCTHQRIRSQWTTSSMINFMVCSRYPSFIRHEPNALRSEMAQFCERHFQWISLHQSYYILLNMSMEFSFSISIDDNLTLVQVTSHCLTHSTEAILKSRQCMGLAYEKSRALDIIKHYSCGNQCC